MRIKAIYRINTEMFMGDQNPDTKARLRSASVKGALRFWFRAVSLAQYKTLDKVQEAEDKVFGSTSCQAQILLSLEGAAGLVTESKPSLKKELAYLGYGLEKEDQSCDKGNKANQKNKKKKALRP